MTGCLGVSSLKVRTVPFTCIPLCWEYSGYTFKLNRVELVFKLNLNILKQLLTRAGAPGHFLRQGISHLFPTGQEGVGGPTPWCPSSISDTTSSAQETSGESFFLSQCLICKMGTKIKHLTHSTVRKTSVSGCVKYKASLDWPPLGGSMIPLLLWDVRAWAEQVPL